MHYPDNTKTAISMLLLQWKLFDTMKVAMPPIGFTDIIIATHLHLLLATTTMPHQSVGLC